MTRSLKAKTPPNTARFTGCPSGRQAVSWAQDGSVNMAARTLIGALREPEPWTPLCGRVSKDFAIGVKSKS